jgi:hypothetical protein
MAVVDRLADLLAERAARRGFARDLFGNLVREEFYPGDRVALERVIGAAKREEYLFAHYIGEAMPRHVRDALDLEIRSWERLYQDLTAAAPDSEFPIRCATLRPRLTSIIDLLSVEEEMLTNPLVAHYEEWLRSYRSP